MVVRKRIGVRMPSARKPRTKVRPSISGSMRSTIKAAYAPLRARAAPSRPSALVSTSWPFARNVSAMSAAMSRSSSISNIFMSLYCLWNLALMASCQKVQELRSFSPQPHWRFV